MPESNSTHFIQLRMYDFVAAHTAEILSGKNARAFLFCGFLMKKFPENMKKIMEAVWKLPAK